MANKFVKYITRDYSLRDRSLMVTALIKRGLIKEIYYTKVLEYRHDGIVDVYVLPEDIESNHKRLQEAMELDKNFISTSLANGLQIADELLALCKVVLREITKTEAIELLRKAEEIWQQFSSFLEFTHRIGNMGIEINDIQLQELGEFHDKRKEIFLKFFDFLDRICFLTTSDDINKRDLRFLAFSEIIAYLNGKVTVEKINELQERRSSQYIYENYGNKEIITDINADGYFTKLSEDFIKNYEAISLKGVAITKGKAVGKVMIVTQVDYRDKNINGKILVTTMTTPNMNAALKNVKAIITEECGLLCHAAILSRELGIITLTQVKEVTKILHDGDLVEVDADKGIVKIIKKAKG